MDHAISGMAATRTSIGIQRRQCDGWTMSIREEYTIQGLRTPRTDINNRRRRCNPEDVIASEGEVGCKAEKM